MRVERLGEDEWERLAQVRLRSLRTEPDLAWALPRESGFREAHWRLRLRGGAAWVAVDAQDVAVLSVISEPGAPPEERHVMSLWVDPAHRRCGAGRALLAAAGESAHAEGATRLTAWAGEDDAVATAFAGSVGFRRTGERVPAPRRPGAEERWALNLVRSVPGPRRPA